MMIVNSEKKVFVAKRVSDLKTQDNVYLQMPQGGMDEGEDEESAMQRELLEETGLHPDDIVILGKTNEWLYYDVPDRLRTGNMNGYVGQMQKWFLLQVINHDKIDLNFTGEPELCDYKWVDAELLPELTIPFKSSTYAKVVNFFNTFLVD